MFDNEYKINTDLAAPYSVCWAKTKDGYPSLSVEEHSYYVGMVFKLILAPFVSKNFTISK